MAAKGLRAQHALYCCLVELTPAEVLAAVEKHFGGLANQAIKSV